MAAEGRRIDHSLRIKSSSARETQEIGRVIGEQAQPGDVYLLTGPLGAGKTCLSQGIGRGLGVKEDLRSPTFVLMTRRQGKLMLYHLDLYRIDDPLEVWDLGIDEQLFGQGVCIVEWADKAAELFPEESCWIAMDYLNDGESREEEEGRTAAFSASTPRFAHLMDSLAAAFSAAEEAV